MKENKISLAGEPACALLQREPNPSQRILVVDDEPLIRQFSTEVLIYSGYEADAAADGAVAWQALNTDNYDLLITDHNMPKVSGVELLKQPRAARMALPVILVSGMIPMEELKRHPWLQIDATLLKPFTVEELLGTVTKVPRATVSAPGQIEPLSDWRSQLPADVLRL